MSLLKHFPLITLFTYSIHRVPQVSQSVSLTLPVEHCCNTVKSTLYTLMFRRMTASAFLRPAAGWYGTGWFQHWPLDAVWSYSTVIRPTRIPKHFGIW